MQRARVLNITEPGAEEEARVIETSREANALIVTDKIEYEYAREMLLGIKDLRKQISDTFSPIIDAAHRAHAEAIAQRKKIESPLIAAETIIKQKIGVFLAEEERKRKAEQDRLRLEIQKTEEKKRIAEAQEALAKGNAEKASEVLLEEAGLCPPSAGVPRSVTPGGGISVRKIWKFRIVDAGKIPREYLTPDLVKIGNAVRTMTESAKIAGVEIYAEDSIAAGRR